MSSIFRDEEIFGFKGDWYNFANLKDLRLKSKGDFFKSGDVTNLENGRVEDISNLERFFNDAVKTEVDDKLQSYCISKSDITDINRKIMTKEYKDFFDNVFEKMKEGTASYNEVIEYWDAKKMFKSNIEFRYSLNNFVKMNSSIDAINAMKVFSFINRGRIAELVTMIDGKQFKDNSVFISREDLMSLLQFDSKDSLRKFLASLEEHEIIYRKNKLNKNNVEFIVNPFLFNRIEKVHLSTHLYEMFPKSFEKFLDLDVWYYFKILKENEHFSFSTSEDV